MWEPLVNRAETTARASFSLIRLITKQCSKQAQKASILGAPGTPKSRKVQKSDLQKNNTLKNEYGKYSKITPHKPVLA